VRTKLGGACDERLVIFKVVVKKWDGKCLRTRFVSQP
jgi:hypothetical protein